MGKSRRPPGSSGVPWGPGKLGRDGELCIPTVTGWDNSCLLKKIERWYRAKHTAGNKGYSGVAWGCLTFFFKLFVAVLPGLLGYRAAVQRSLKRLN